MGFENIYLVGFDFIPHINKTEGILPTEKESNYFKISPSEVSLGLKNQMDCFPMVKWIHNNIWQTNPKSRLKLFNYKLPEEVANG